MQRRAFLKWAISGLGAVVGAVLGIPAIAYFTDARNRPARQTDFRTVAKLGDLEVGTPRQFVITETHADAWNLHPDDIVGRVWLIRLPPDLVIAAGGTALAPVALAAVTQQPMVIAFQTICPHLGCSINWLDDQREFLCPCHGGNYHEDGTRILAEGRRNPAPRDMDKLDCRVVDDPQNPGTKVVQVRYQRFKTNQSTKEVDA
jgi:Rieske Fe-S protein